MKNSWWLNLKVGWQLQKLFSRKYEPVFDSLQKLPASPSIEDDAVRIEMMWVLIRLFDIYNSKYCSVDVLLLCIEVADQTPEGRYFFVDDLVEIADNYGIENRVGIN